ncbi:hypothetical protein A8950_2774 [Dongia mobilis]|uniref:NAD(FAD)-utilizing dehydrogenase n=1 Tax=Dongia mobilis TaxID=578943 RepID=A0A4R6WPD3_9PROT|nr:TIGR03862 family flavoprotein [Dongia mobilis]TDQ80905.1 hypothetical protein A8950_2774 [Dongia mobilis]
MADAIVIGGGPAGLMAAEQLLAAGITVDLFEAMPSLGRKFLMAGKGGLNITHAEPMDGFIARYGDAAPRIACWLDAFGPIALRDWIRGLGIETFVGSSGRVFPAEMKAAPLLRAWLHRLRGQGLRIHVRHRWLGWNSAGSLEFAKPGGKTTSAARVVVLALGGGSWPQLGSDGSWVSLLTARGVPVSPLQPANCGFEIAWSEAFRTKYAGAPLKNIAIDVSGLRRRGEAVIAEYGIEGGAVYAVSAPLRERLTKDGTAILSLDLLPNHSLEQVSGALAAPRGSRSLSSHLKSRLRLDSVKVALIRELLGPDLPSDLAPLLKALPLRVRAPRPLAEAISTAGGIAFTALDDHLMLKSLPGVFCAGEMLDWEAPTGGYLLTACFASGLVAGRSAAIRLRTA